MDILFLSLPWWQVFCIAEDDTNADSLKADVRQFLYDLRMQADVIVVTMKAWDDVQSDAEGPEAELARQGAMEAFTRVREGGIMHSVHCVHQDVATSQGIMHSVHYVHQEVATNRGITHRPHCVHQDNVWHCTTARGTFMPLSQSLYVNIL